MHVYIIPGGGGSRVKSSKSSLAVTVVPALLGIWKTLSVFKQANKPTYEGPSFTACALLSPPGLVPPPPSKFSTSLELPLLSLNTA